MAKRVKKHKKVNENREVKSDVFSMLLEEKEYALSVYNALNGSNYDVPELVQIKKLDKGISLSIRNDSAFIVDMTLSLYEHQSTYNPNMPLRSLIYITEIVKTMIKNHDLLGSQLVKIPTPKFAVFYNGTVKRPMKEVLKLSDAFENVAEEPELELICTVYNINPGMNEELLAKCEVLKWYTYFIEKIREYQADEIENPIERAIDCCVANGILSDFLTRRREEVIKHMTIDMTFEAREKIFRKEEYKAGYDSGYADRQAEVDKLTLAYEDEKQKLEEKIREFEEYKRLHP